MTTTPHLQGLRVLLTRPVNRLAALSAAVVATGATPMALPLISIEPLQDRSARQHIKQCVLGLDRYDMALFVSINAVEYAMHWIDQYWPQLPHGLQAYTVGAGTGQVLAAFGWPVRWPEQGVTSEALLALPELQDLHGKRVVLFRGDGGRELLASTLRARGATVDVVALYARRNIHYADAELLRLLHAGLPHAVLLNSGQILQAWQQLLDGLDDAGLANRLRHCPVLLPSARVAALARAAGFASAIDCSGASDACMVACLQQHASLIRGGATHNNGAGDE